MTNEMKPLIYAASEGPLSMAQAKLAFDTIRAINSEEHKIGRASCRERV